METIRPFTPLERHTEVLSSALPKESKQQFIGATKGQGLGGHRAAAPSTAPSREISVLR